MEQPKSNLSKNKGKKGNEKRLRQVQRKKGISEKREREREKCH